MSTRGKRGRDFSNISEKPMCPFSTNSRSAGGSPVDDPYHPQLSTSSSSGGAALLSSSGSGGLGAGGGWKEQLGKLQNMLDSEGEALAAREQELQRTREVSRLSAERIHFMKENNHFVTLCVGGTEFTVHVHTLLRDQGSIFESLLDKSFRVEIDRSWRKSIMDGKQRKSSKNSGSRKQKAAQNQHPPGVFSSSLPPAAVLVPPSMTVTSSPPMLIDRDPESFKYILNYLRGYKKISIPEDEKQLVLEDIDYYNLPKMRAMLVGSTSPAPAGFTASNLTIEPIDYTQRLLPGPGVNAEGTRLRVAYAVSPVGEPMLVAGRHVISYEILSGEYIGLGVISENCKITDGEFHKTVNCCVYYMTGVFYSNFPNQKKEEGLAKYSTPDTVTLILDMDDKTIEYIVNGFTTKIVSCASASRLKFAVVGKLKSGVNIVKSDPFYLRGGQGQVMPSSDYVPSFNPELHPKPEGDEDEEEEEELGEGRDEEHPNEAQQQQSPVLNSNANTSSNNAMLPLPPPPPPPQAPTTAPPGLASINDGSPTERRVRGSNSSLLARVAFMEDRGVDSSTTLPRAQQQQTQLPPPPPLQAQRTSASAPHSPVMINPTPTQPNNGSNASS